MSSVVAVVSRVPLIVDSRGAYKESNTGCGEQWIGLAMDAVGAGGAFGLTEPMIRRFAESLVGTILPW
ncbi:hypothetical protein AB0I77_01595 [Streptomyces sp. NPDC050619]|uniref:hypothetical protein n=1 Tax=Streptomyces sp. NPDC050619 TaxID=3157214 RepID=UPI00343833FD